MTDIGLLVEELIVAGCDPAVAARVIAEAFTAGVASTFHRNSTGVPVDEVAEKRRAYDRERKRKSTGNPPDSTGTPRNSENASLSKQGSKEEERKREAGRGSSRGQRLPENWEPSPQDRATGEILVGDRMAGELDKFRDHWKQQPGSKGVKLDWDAAWRNWIRRAAEYAGAKNGKTGSKIIQAADDLCRKIASFDGPPKREPGIRDPESPFAPRLLSNR